MVTLRGKMALFFLHLNVFSLTYCHDEDITSVQSASTEDEGQSRYLQSINSRRYSYKGIPIEMHQPERRSNFAPVFSSIVTPATTRRTTTTTTSAPQTTPIHPPLDRRYRRIYNPDERASVEDYPFMAALLVNNELWCGAAIIGPDRVLTAAHCLQL
ncbi:uncharacterized protein LOC113229055 [Hyposmocoma kahamanoa]|uniref:uncharacterized protein LOC113229055 n=1 Tax=Hyposmocoma kahamanoa TaxID=1477025 RepID=UPI000E6D95A9|nr:uncharacterized protein LOC113229055 [Hyposmocoma kahamanoa]